jgi:hypothetical protein
LLQAVSAWLRLMALAQAANQQYDIQMKLADALKTSLDELRMQMLGTQVLLGFQFQGLFQDKFPFPEAAARITAAAGMSLLVIALGLMMAIPCQHRFIEGGEDTRRIYAASKRYAQLAFLPLACGIGCNLFVAMAGPFGAAMATGFALAASSMAIGAWYGLGIVLRRYGFTPKGEAPMKESQTPLHTKIEQMLTEARVILPGAQALLGFQFVVMLTKAFAELPASVRAVHLVALMCLALTITLLIAPAAIHRLTFGGNDDPRMHALGSLLMSIALLPLAFGLSCDIWIALTKLFPEHDSLALSGASAAFALLMTLWYLLPLILRRYCTSPASIR